MKKKRLLVMAGGTGGHVFPGISVAKLLQLEGFEVRWLGTADRMEAQLVPAHGFDIDFIRVSGLRGSGVLKKCLAPFMIVKAIYQAKKHLNNWQPDVVLGMGGYVCGPGGIAAYLSGIPLVIHEQNAVAGLTNTWLSKIATRVLQAFPTAFVNAEVVGNPVRESICKLAPKKAYQTHKPLHILVVGGSQGALILNQIVAKALSEFDRDFIVHHQAGKGQDAETLKRYQDLGIQSASVYEFIDDMAAAYAWADLVICRSGALTVSEIAVAGLPAIFVPFQHADRQQALNAEYLVKAGAALLIEQSDFTAQTLSSQLNAIDAMRLEQMAKAAKVCAIDDAASRVATVIMELANLRETN